MALRAWHTWGFRYPFKSGDPCKDGSPYVDKNGPLASRIVAFDDESGELLGSFILDTNELKLPDKQTDPSKAIQALRPLALKLSELVGLSVIDDEFADLFAEDEKQSDTLDQAREPEPKKEIPDNPLVLPKWDDLSRNRPGQLISHLAKENSSYATGIRGEIMTAGVLNSIPGMKVLHSIPATGRRDIDHIAIHSSGVYVINSKNLRTEIRVFERGGRVSIDAGQGNKSIAQDTRIDADAVSNVIESTVGVNIQPKPMIVSWGAGGVVYEVKDDLVVDGFELESHINSQPKELNSLLVDEIYHELRKSSTWKSIF